ncbi:Hypothetical protein D9617_20g026830 [Elsinoe fawcettii]|nr:Hypothetical protein D9617_20g026830 [Elsinoe fawcettii]
MTSHLLTVRVATGASTSGYVASISIKDVLANILHIRYIAIALTILITLSIVLRVSVRYQRLDASDYYMFAAFIFTLLHNILSIYNSVVTWDIWHGELELAHRFLLVLRAAGVFYTFALITVKLSICHFFLGIFTHMKPQRIIIHVIMAVSTFVGVVYVVVGYFTCASVKSLPGFEDTHCPARLQTAATVLFVIFSVVTIVGDFSLALMGINALWHIQLPLPSRISACLLLALGSVGGVASSIRLAVVLEPTDFARYTQQSFTLLEWVLIELAVSVCAANMAMARMLFQKLMTRLGLMSREGTGYHEGPSTVGSKSNKVVQDREKMSGIIMQTTMRADLDDDIESGTSSN